MAWAWFDIYNLSEMETKGIPQKEIEVDLEGLGIQKILIFKNRFYGVIFKETVLIPKLNGRNGFEKNGVSAYIDEQKHLWVGYNEN